LGASGASRLMVSHRLRSISSVFGGKNSKEMFGDPGARCPSVADEVTSVMTPQTPVGRSGTLTRSCSAHKISQNELPIQPIHDGKLPNCLEIYLDVRSIYQSSGLHFANENFTNILILIHKMKMRVCRLLFQGCGQVGINRIIATRGPLAMTVVSVRRRVDARLICTAWPFVGPTDSTSLRA